ncbi:NADH-quinone oxidoreductase subunit N [Paenactinomyces guangxiensis]|uniref:NADH-quinone oxidoreductase subunit N n=1 Tax=Paenactinomyces guangxiensis TaxID=1490290 RepID=A0A7W1WU07_9BACL|nr:NADH-quinone oxidoreductase subunit N [Paenactinomyces guangxiensis]MBA4495973.1 NADH-quinone oxidoreductase subunit N [Paenactinomyces guangxiensis]MBH8593040.1 NADH-quinone oxidoreductase subunit N [Paenactinomyces guangxiensis]
MEQYLLDFDLKVMAPELVIVSAAALLSVIDLVLKESVPRKIIGVLSLLSVIAAGVFVGMGFDHPSYQILGDTYRIDPYSLTFKGIILAGTALVLLFSLGQKKEDPEAKEGEYYYLLLTAVLGGMIMVSSADLITLFVGLELLSLSSYILVGIRKKELQSNEAAWKYVVLGGVSSAFILYGMSFVYGLTGSTNLFTIQQRMMEALNGGYELIIFLSLFLMVVGFGFKIATAPFQMWTPDVYQGASTPITAFLSVVSKTAAFAFVMRILLIAYVPLINTGAWEEVVGPLLIIIAALSMIVGNTVALKQTNAKRLMAYSSIAQAGYILVPLATLGLMPFSSMAYYLLVYLFMTMGAFCIIDLVTRESENEKISAFAGLHRKSPWLAFAMSVFLISLAGIPVTAGFFGKFYLLTSAVSSQKFWLAGIMIVTTIISYYYYFGIIRQMYFRSAPSVAAIPVPWTAGLVIVIGLAGTIGLGIYPDAVVQFLGKINWGLGLSPAENMMQQ